MWSERNCGTREVGGEGQVQGYYTAIISLPKLGAQSWETNTEDSHFVLLDVLTPTQFSGFV